MTALDFNYEAQLAACSRGNQEALQTIYLHEAPRMLALCLKMFPERSIAEEIVRESFLLIWKHADSYDQRLGSARAWMYSILRYRALTRRRRSAPSSSSGDTVPLSIRENQDRTLIESTFLNALHEDQQQVILQAYQRGHTYSELSASMRIPAHRLRRETQEALTQIREHCQA